MRSITFLAFCVAQTLCEQVLEPSSWSEMGAKYWIDGPTPMDLDLWRSIDGIKWDSYDYKTHSPVYNTTKTFTFSYDDIVDQ